VRRLAPISLLILLLVSLQTLGGVCSIRCGAMQTRMAICGSAAAMAGGRGMAMGSAAGKADRLSPPATPCDRDCQLDWNTRQRRADVTLDGHLPVVGVVPPGGQTLPRAGSMRTVLMQAWRGLPPLSALDPLRSGLRI